MVHYELVDGVAVITIDNPPVNAMSPGVPEGILGHLDVAARDEAVKAVVLIGGGRTFIAGADIKEFVKFTSGEKEPSDVLRNRAAAARIGDCRDSDVVRPAPRPPYAPLLVDCCFLPLVI